MQATPMQLVCSRDAVMNIPGRRRGHKNKTKKTQKYEYRVGDKILLSNPPHQKYGGSQYEGSYVILAVNDNSTLTIQ